METAPKQVHTIVLETYGMDSLQLEALLKSLVLTSPPVDTQRVKELLHAQSLAWAHVHSLELVESHIEEEPSTGGDDEIA